MPGEWGEDVASSLCLPVSRMSTRDEVIRFLTDWMEFWNMDVEMGDDTGLVRVEERPSVEHIIQRLVLIADHLCS